MHIKAGVSKGSLRLRVEIKKKACWERSAGISKRFPPLLVGGRAAGGRRRAPSIPAPPTWESAAGGRRVLPPFQHPHTYTKTCACRAVEIVRRAGAERLPPLQHPHMHTGEDMRAPLCEAPSKCRGRSFQKGNFSTQCGGRASSQTPSTPARPHAHRRRQAGASM